MSSHAFDPDQRAAVDVTANAVVAAGAGSGKTTVLAGRYLRLVREGARVPRILTLTFTRKAAAEMYSRIHRLLAENDDDPRVAEQLRLFDQARISTLDSFCSRLARNDPARFGLPLGFAVDQEGLARAAEGAALEFLLDNHRHPALKELVAASGFESVWKDLLASYAVRELKITDEPRHAADFARQEDECRRRLTGALARLDELYARAGRAAADGKGKTAADALRAAADWPDTAELLAGEEWERLSLLAGTKPWRKPGSNSTDPALLILREILEELVPVGEEAVSLIAVLSRREIYAGLMELMDEFALRWRELKRRRGLVSFADVVAMAVTLLIENSELRGYYKRQFSHIMIDEFQDNNEIQKELLYLLAEKEEILSPGIPAPEDLDPAKLFFVGDEKQSIYRFRGADVSVFKRLANELGGESIELRTNYRSDPRLIERFNALFPTVFANAEGKEYEADFRPLKGRPADPAAPEPEFGLHLIDAEGDGDDELLTGVESEAFEAARIIREAVDGRGLQIVRDGVKTSPGWNDFALLLRSTGNQIIYESVFRRFGIPYTTENIRTLFLEAPANDIYAALQTALYPEDRLAYAVFLRSFFVNLSDDALLRELLGETPPFEGDVSSWEEAEAEKYRRGAEIVAFLRTSVDRLSHREILRRLWFEYGYRYNLLKRESYHGYLEFYDYLTGLADKSWEAGESMVLFLDFLRDNLGEYRKIEEIEVIRESQEGVRIMTVHKSKGLEFPVVLLGSAGQGSGGPGKRAPYYIDAEYGFTVNLRVRTEKGRQKFNPFYERSLVESEAQEAAEMKRLLYVACTRAEQHMFILGYRPRRRSGGVPTLLDLTLDGLGADPDSPEDDRIRIVPRPTREQLNALSRGGSSRRAVEPYAAALERAGFRMPAPKMPVSVTALNRAWTASLPSEEGELLAPLAVDDLILDREESFGTLAHRCLELLIGGRNPLEAEGGDWPPGQAERIVAAAASLATEFWNSPARKELFPAGCRPESEVGFSLRLDADGVPGSLIVDGAIDLFADAGDRIVCVDFKTNRRRRRGEYALQMWLYRRALERLTGKPVETWLVYLRDDRPVREETSFDPRTVLELAAPDGGE